MRNHAHAPAIEVEGKSGNTKIYTWTTLHSKTNGVVCELYYPGVTDVKSKSSVEYLITTLKKP